jgi:hypothetical protein
MNGWRGFAPEIVTPLSVHYVPLRTDADGALPRVGFEVPASGERLGGALITTASVVSRATHVGAVQTTDLPGGVTLAVRR